MRKTRGYEQGETRSLLYAVCNSAQMVSEEVLPAGSHMLCAAAMLSASWCGGTSDASSPTPSQNFHLQMNRF